MAEIMLADDGNYYNYDPNTGLDMSNPLRSDGTSLNGTTTAPLPPAPDGRYVGEAKPGTGITQGEGGYIPEVTQYKNLDTGQLLSPTYAPPTSDQTYSQLQNGQYVSVTSPEYQAAMDAYQSSQSLWGDIGPGIMNSIAFFGAVGFGSALVSGAGGVGAGVAGDALAADGGMFGLPTATSAGGVSAATGSTAGAAGWVSAEGGAGYAGGLAADAPTAGGGLLNSVVGEPYTPDASQYTDAPPQIDTQPPAPTVEKSFNANTIDRIRNSSPELIPESLVNGGIPTTGSRLADRALLEVGKTVIKSAITDTPDTQADTTPARRNEVGGLSFSDILLEYRPAPMLDGWNRTGST